MSVKKIVLTVFTLVFAELLVVACSRDEGGEGGERGERGKGGELHFTSPYEVLMRSVADSSDFDWEFLSAIAYTESRYRADIRSPRGARGLMQIMPHTAINMGFDSVRLEDPQVSIQIANKLLHTIAHTFRFPSHMAQSDRLKVILAAYNAGPGYILRVRKDAAAEGAAFNNFEVLSRYITRDGTHGETVDFANRVYSKYLQYLSMGAKNA